MDDTITATESTKEYYKYTFAELVILEGKEKAIAIAENYISLVKLYPNFKEWCIIKSPLYTTYQPNDATTELGGLFPDRVCSVYYNPITNKTKKKDLTLLQVAELIKSPVFKRPTEHLRTLKKRNANRAYKQTAFSYATFSGTFSYCADKDLIKHSGLICIDLDHLNERLKEVRGIVNNDPLTVMSFISPNGDGLKVIYDIDPETYTQEQYYRACSNYLRDLCDIPPGSIDSSCKNVSRACFLPFDPELFLNPVFAAS